MPDGINVFLSHNAADKPFVRRVARDLESQGVDVWLDEWSIRPGESISSKIEEALQEYDLFLIVLTPSSVQSEWVKEELRVAYRLRIGKSRQKIIPILRKKCKIPMFLKDYKYIDFTNRNFYSKALSQLCDAIVFDKSLIGRYRKAYHGGILIDETKVLANIGGRKGDLVTFTEDIRFRGMKTVKKIRKEFYHNGEIVFVQADGFKVVRKRANRFAERWFLLPKSNIGLGVDGRFTLTYQLRNEFKDDSSWYYTIDAPTRSLRFDWVFREAKAPGSFRCTEYQPPTPIRKILLANQSLKNKIRYRLEADFPTFRTKYEFTWK
jgi:hypothetical protein